ncbi:WD40 repeat-like protein [Gymnopus androsaceus JB14]|uniref:WD40 repeat-like protein n=1 Tax=Gymnopus androsaceus JB14 TaxID=1447944 RepID=A0A6A4GJV6_9AGAR|nr:WD40 repeat-like protein [Gymnopus androsaceus JB14]
MLPSPSSSPAQKLRTLHNFTNLPHKSDNNRPNSSHPWLQLPTPPTHLKRPSSEAHDSPSKRAKLIVDGDDESSEAEEEWVEHARTRFRRRTCNPSRAFRSPVSYHGSTRPVLDSFVSSLKSDLFRCESVEDGFLTPPYACAYSHSAKRGSVPLLAVSTEEGSVHIFNTLKREEWDPEPSRSTLQPHASGIFDVKWSPSDSHLATCSGDRSARISCPNTSQLLHTLNGHSASLKCVSWHPSNDSLLSTGGRDGTVCVWDLRVPENAPINHQSSIQRGNVDLRNPNASCLPFCSPTDPTTSHGSRRARGILSLTAGLGPSSGLLFALGADSRIHTYSASSLTALPISFTDPNMCVNGSFYLSSAVSPCGRWLASGGGKSTFLFERVELKAQLGEVYAVDWAEGMIASCADDRTVRVWRPDVEVYRNCLETPDESKWRWSWATTSSNIDGNETLL